jgi:hypothetical protein
VFDLADYAGPLRRRGDLQQVASGRDGSSAGRAVCPTQARRAARQHERRNGARGRAHLAEKGIIDRGGGSPIGETALYRPVDGRYALSCWSDRADARACRMAVNSEVVEDSVRLGLQCDSLSLLAFGLNLAVEPACGRSQPWVGSVGACHAGSGRKSHQVPSNGNAPV